MILMTIILMFIPSAGTLEGLNVCKRYKSAISDEGKEVKVEEKFCCAGFKPQNNRCVECHDCTETNCPSGFCGTGCVQQCNCPSFSRCDLQKCCICNAGKTGRNCDQTCPRGYFGEDCTARCSCSEHSTCNVVNGECLCNEGWTGSNCTVAIIKFPNSTCPSNCDCTNPHCTREDCQCSSHNDNHTDDNSTDVGVTISVQASGDTGVFSILILSMSGVVVFVLITFFVTLVFLSKTRQKYQIPEHSHADGGHYDEINPYDEIPSEELARRRAPYYSSPAVIGRIPRTRSLPYIKISINKLRRSKHGNDEFCLPKYLSLPNLNDANAQYSHYISLNKSRYDRRYEALTSDNQETINRSGYLHPYNTLIRPDITGSGYIHPYNTLQKQDSVSANLSVNNDNNILKSSTDFNQKINDDVLCLESISVNKDITLDQAELNGSVQNSRAEERFETTSKIIQTEMT